LLNLFFGICGGALFGIVVTAFVMWSVGSATADAALYTGMITGITFGAFIGAFAAYMGTA
jgi:ABC-type enterobactin transport system permease subunit